MRKQSKVCNLSKFPKEKKMSKIEKKEVCISGTDMFDIGCRLYVDKGVADDKAGNGDLVFR